MSCPSTSLTTDDALLLSCTQTLNPKLVTSLVIIDAMVDDLTMLLADVGSDSEVVILDSQQNGIEQITAVLVQHPQLTQIHIVSHGSSGCLSLGNAKLNLNTIGQYARHWFLKG